MTLILYGIFLAHINSYREYYSRIGITFAVTYAMKRLIRSSGKKDDADLIGLAGYSLTIGEFFNLLGAMKKSSVYGGNSEEANKIISGLFGKGIDLIKDLVIGK